MDFFKIIDLLGAYFSGFGLVTIALISFGLVMSCPYLIRRVFDYV